MKKKYIHTEKGWFEVVNDNARFYILKRVSSLCPKDKVDDYISFESDPIDILITILKKGVNITNEIIGNDYKNYLEETKNCSEPYILNEKEFDSIKALTTKLLKKEITK